VSATKVIARRRSGSAMMPSITRMTTASRRRTKPAKTPRPSPITEVIAATMSPTSREIRLP
jgi:hypothetical protein